MDYSLTKIQPIQVALWNGIVMGGGVGLSQNAPIRVATDNSVWAMPGKFYFLIPSSSIKLNKTLLDLNFSHSPLK